MKIFRLKMKFFTYILCLGVILSCNNKETPSGLNNEGKFHNYISLNDKVFKDGDTDFYPMIMNYSIDVNVFTDSNKTRFFVSPRAGCHPNYGKTNDMHPWGNDSLKNYNTISTHFASIKDLGFNTIRLTGFTATEYDNSFYTWSKIDISNSPIGNKNITTTMVPLMRGLISLAEENDLRVILLLSAVENQPENTNNYYSKVAKELAHEKALLGYDLYNEPIYFDRGNYTKKQTTAFVKSYNKSIKKVAPKHLTCIGLSHYKIVYEWDPELMDVDFLSFHIYPYGSKNLSILERFDAKLYWIEKNITKPWVVGETGLNTAENCEPLNFSWGNYSDQLYFMSYSLNKCRSAGASGYSWWSFQDVKLPNNQTSGTCTSSDYGLVNRKNTFYLNSNNDTIIGGLKHPIEKLPFKKFVNDKPYKTSIWDGVGMPKMYYNIDYLPDHEKAFGKVLDENQEPIEHAIVTLKNPISGSVYTTFTKPDGSFELFTGWTNVFTKLDFKLRVTAVKKETLELSLKDIYAGQGNIFEAIILPDFKP